MRAIFLLLFSQLFKNYRWTLALWCVTFVIILPYFAQKWVFSPFFHASEEYKTKANDTVRDLNMMRFFEAQKYLSSLKSKANRNLHSEALAGISSSGRIKMMTMVITKRRSIECKPQHALNLNCEPHYLQQTLVALDKEVKVHTGVDKSHFIPIVICNVDEDWKDWRDFEMVKDAFPVTNRFPVRPNITENLNSNTERRTQETSDYAFCLEAAMNMTNSQNQPNYTIVFQDDALAFPHLFKNLFHILESRIELAFSCQDYNPGCPWSFVKLHYPENWAGFGLDLRTLAELANIACIGALVGIFLRFLFSLRRKTRPNHTTLIICGVISAVYAILVAAVISRQTLLEIRRISPYFLKVSQAPGCCIPAMVYPTKILPVVVQYLKSPNCDQCSSGVDLALDDFSRNMSYLIEPNLVGHIGMHSTLTTPKNPVPMLFHDLLYG